MATLLIGYDVETCAIGEGLACLGAHGMGEAIDRTSTAKALDVIRRNHETFAVPATLFVCGRTLVHNVGVLEQFVDHPLFDIQQHTYSHTLLKNDHWKGGTFLASPPEAIDQEIRQTSEALERLLGVECIGLRTPHGYHLGLTDRPEMLAVLHERGIKFVSSWARNAEGTNPTPLSVQPFWYAEQGFPDLLEIPSSTGWMGPGSRSTASSAAPSSPTCCARRSTRSFATTWCTAPASTTGRSCATGRRRLVGSGRSWSTPRRTAPRRCRIASTTCVRARPASPPNAPNLRAAGPRALRRCAAQTWLDVAPEPSSCHEGAPIQGPHHPSGKGRTCATAGGSE